MTDEQFEECLAQIEGTTLPLSDEDSKPFVAEVRRLRELERAVRAILTWPTSLDEVEYPGERQLAAIGRLLEEPKEAEGE